MLVKLIITVVDIKSKVDAKTVTELAIFETFSVIKTE